VAPLPPECRDGSRQARRTAALLRRMFPANLFLGSAADAATLAGWRGKGIARGDISADEMLMIWKKEGEPVCHG
jgi:hypothetical protein